ncbi:MAG TPA: undecaprenyl-diphosphate phosphatase [Phnomibacter sp.]|nr:undecaprenyl-diphosphate phosphatase [Phnomibacter sp.]
MGSFEAIILAIVEGITDIMPVAARGHLHAIAHLLDLKDDKFANLYMDLLQFGVVMAVLYSYWKRFTKLDTSHFYRKLLLGSVPTLVVFFVAGIFFEKYLLTNRAIALALILGGIFFLFVDFVFRDSERSVKRMSRIGTGNAIAVGIWQIAGLVPGLGRPAAAIIGGLQQGLTRTMAAEFSFFISVPTYLGMSFYRLITAMIQQPDNLRENATYLVLGNGISFVVGLITVRFMMQFIEKFGFKYFGWYRIVAGFAILYLSSKGLME